MIRRVTVDWGDGSAVTVFNASSAGALAAQNHTYISTGARTVIVTVRDKNNDTGSAQFGVNVSAATVTPTPIPVQELDFQQFLPAVQRP